MPDAIATAPGRAGWSIPSFCEACGFSRATLYNLPPQMQPSSVKFGKRRIINEQPADFLARLAATQKAVRAEVA